MSKFVAISPLLAGTLAVFLSCDASAQDFIRKGRLPRFKMPGESFKGELPTLSEAEKTLSAKLKKDVEVLAGDIGERNVYNYAKLVEAASFLEDSLKSVDYTVERQTYEVRGRECSNLIVEIRGSEKPDEIIVIGGHYDSAPGTPGANDNASGTVATLALARAFVGKVPQRTLRFVFFVNEEPPWFQTESMGSLVYARRCKKREENIVAMMSLETVGYFSNEEESQKYPPPFSLYYPSVGNFIGFVGNVRSGPLVSWTVKNFRGHARMPSEGSAVPGRITGVGWSDHWSFWQVGYPAMMVTDTAPFRYPHYHQKSDTPDKLDYEQMARIVAGLEKVIEELALPVDGSEDD